MSSTLKEQFGGNLVSRLALHILVDPEWSRERDIVRVASAAIDGGATVIQLRDKKASTRLLVEQGLALRKLTHERGVLFIVNDRIDVALAVDADGAHIGQGDDMPVQMARQLLGPQRILGVSAGNLTEAAAAVAADADYLSIGPICSTRAKADAGPAIGTHLIAELATRYTTPLIGIGGITATNAAEVLRTGAIGVAVITAVVSADDITAATRELATALRGA
ncbi:MAG: thiamine phosphate synthase, partial [Ktedonobacteraceae bacterium]|nr:thiamine phosphate synthase [Ktedonobacteraceae bacterium]